MRNFLSALFGGPSKRALAHAHTAAEKARLQAINRDPPPGNGWRLAPQDSEGKWTVWNGPRPMASFWDENEAAEWARKQNRDPGRPNPVEREDGKYCVNCRSRETTDSLKARGYVSCCPERYVIPEAWAVTDKLATGQFHLWRPAGGLETITDDSWADQADARHEADHRNLLAHRPHAAEIYVSTPGGPSNPFHTTGFVQVEGEPRPPKATGEWATVWDRAAAEVRPDLAEFLSVAIPAGLKVTVGPCKHPTLGNWWTFDASGPVKGYTRKSNAQAAADRANNAPQT